MKYVLSLTPDELAIVNAALDYLNTDEARQLRELIRWERLVEGEWKSGVGATDADEDEPDELYVPPKG